MKKVLQINTTCNTGSTGRIAEQIGMLAIKQGWDCYLAHGARYVRPTSLKPIQISTYFGEILHWFQSVLFDAQGLGSRKSTIKFCEKIDEINPDIIHIHLLHGCYINYKILFEYIKKREIPVVWTIHDCWPFTGHCVHFVKKSCFRWKTKCYQCPLLNDFPRSYFYDGSTRNYKRKKKAFASIQKMIIVPVSNWLGGMIEQSFLGKFPVQIIYNGVNVNVFKPVKSDLKIQLGLEKKYMLLGVAQEFGKRKGLKDFCKLSRILRDDFQIVLVGLSDKEMKQVEDTSIIGFSQTSDVKQLVEFYSEANILLSLSYEETFGLTIVEGMACGTPAVIYDNTGQSEIVTNDTGIKVRTGDIEAVKLAVEEICAKGKDFYSQKCQERVTRMFNKDKQFDDYIQVYEKLLTM